jgi:3-oxocholest-4-en-26-oyl-CoA dehydrogenase beta subunit
MDFAFTEGQTAVAELARKIFEERVTPASLKAIGASADPFDRGLWRELASTGLLGIAIPEEHGGAGHGFLELLALLEEAGAAIAPVPLWATLVLGALPIAEFGTAAQHAAHLPQVVRGEIVLSAALAEPNGSDPTFIQTTARTDRGAWILRGAKTCVPAAASAERVLVPAATGGGKLGIFFVDPNAPGVKLARQIATTGEEQWHMSLDETRVAAEDVLGDPERGAEILDWLLERATVALCALELGVVERAVRMTASYTSTRNQFDRPIATFQAVSQRAADAYIDVESIRVTTWQAAWRISAGLPATEAVSTAKFFAAEAGHRAVFAAQHLHGGMGFDVEYPLHRHYLLSKQIELTLGCASEHIERLGRAIAG